jgi:hypothetical protein
MTDEPHIIIAHEVSVVGIPLISAILGAIIVVFVFGLVTGAGRFGYRGPRVLNPRGKRIAPSGDISRRDLGSWLHWWLPCSGRRYSCTTSAPIRDFPHGSLGCFERY